MRVVLLLLIPCLLSCLACRPASVQKGQELEAQLAEVNRKSRDRINAVWKSTDEANQGLGKREKLIVGTIKVPLGFLPFNAGDANLGWQGPPQPGSAPKIVCATYQLENFIGTIKDVSIQDAIRTLSKEKKQRFIVTSEMELGKVGDYQAAREDWKRSSQDEVTTTYLIVAGDHIVKFDLVNCDSSFRELCEAAVFSYQHDPQ